MVSESVFSHSLSLSFNHRATYSYSYCFLHHFHSYLASVIPNASLFISYSVVFSSLFLPLVYYLLLTRFFHASDPYCINISLSGLISLSVPETQRRGSRRNRARLRCYRCKELGHVAQDCSGKRVRGQGAVATLAPSRSVNAALSVVNVYVEGKRCSALVDTGCSRSIVSADRCVTWNSQQIEIRTIDGVSRACCGVGTVSCQSRRLGGTSKARRVRPATWD
ncbi:unnamed protein product [Acanthosepion pharaonis]|uniref:CCHC-type domain-containing protein n=1 Tax=Acanthosepion pharaonis TaxID=158019 RepID=A0A812CWF2_ACAPH|nr:unnamed protein product [Sepia pharaonis]